MTNKIPVTVVCGFLGSGKTTLLNRLLNPAGAAASAPDRIAVVVNEIGQVGIDHELVRHVTDSVVLLQSGCVCCTVRGELVGALRDLFFAALQKKIPVFSRVLIETTGLADPAPIIFTTRHETFLKERYRYDGCITVVDCVYGRRQLRANPEAVRQAVLADCIVLSKADLAEAEELAALRTDLGDLNATARQYVMQDAPGLAAMLEASSLHANLAVGTHAFSAGMLTGPGGRIKSVATRHPDVHVITVTWPHPISRSAFSTAMSVLQTLPGIDLLRIKGLIRFEDEAQVSVVHGMHERLYPITPVVFRPEAEPATGATGSVMVFVVRGAGRGEFERQAGILLGNAGIPESNGQPGRKMRK